MKKCPYCTEEIKDEAVKCRYCGEWLDKIITVQTDEYADGSHSSDITNKAKLNNEPPATSSENNFQHTDAVNADIAFDNGEKLIAEKQAIADTVEDSFKQFKRIVLLMYVGLIPMFFATSFIEALKPFAIFGYIIFVFYFWSHLWSCARLVGKNPFLWITISGALLFLGPAYAYQMLKKSAEDQGYISSYILKPNAESVWRGNRAGWIAAIVTFCFFFAMFSYAQDPPKPLGGVIQGLIWGIIVGWLVQYLTKRPKHEKDKTA